MYNRHLELLTVSVHVPHRRRATVRITMQQHRLATYHAAGKGAGKSQRQQAAEIGYSLAGYNEALHSLRSLGVLAVSTTRGWAGSTVAWLIKGVRVLSFRAAEAMFGNVGSIGSTVTNNTRTLPNIEVNRGTGPPGGPSMLGDILPNLLRTEG